MRPFPHGDRLPAALALAGTCCRDEIPAVEWHLTLEPLRQQIFPPSPSMLVLGQNTQPVHWLRALELRANIFVPLRH
ncbi:hypothetical protein AB0N62_45255 [Streptomyces sp. NPDC093982]|uniref:hypothetical protein n=1 Tax=Streptomyces sp. NPDC093982 TaxID=3155077 RepID=UPI0034301E70